MELITGQDEKLSTRDHVTKHSDNRDGKPENRKRKKKEKVFFIQYKHRLIEKLDEEWIHFNPWVSIK